MAGGFREANRLCRTKWSCPDGARLGNRQVEKLSMVWGRVGSQSIGKPLADCLHAVFRTSKRTLFKYRFA
jgi:hypothetical protein